MSIIAGLIAAIPSIIQMVQGGKQEKQAQKIEDQYPRPDAGIAPSIEKYTNYAYGRTLNQDVPGGEMYRNEIKGATSAGLKAASEMGAGAEAYGAMGQMVGREQNQFGNLAKLTAQQVAGYQGDYMNALSTKAGEENRVWNWNEAQPYLQAAQIAAAMRNAGMQNQFAGVNNLAGIAANEVSGNNMINALNQDNQSTFYREDKGSLDNYLRMMLNKLKSTPESAGTGNLSSPNLFSTPNTLAPAQTTRPSGGSSYSQLPIYKQ
jgi:hypothetical protein